MKKCSLLVTESISSCFNSFLIIEIINTLYYEVGNKNSFEFLARRCKHHLVFLGCIIFGVSKEIFSAAEIAH